MAERTPRIVRFSDYALAKAELLGVTRTDLENAVLERHSRRKRNWLRFEGYDTKRVIAEEVEFGLREVDQDSGTVVGLEYWRASQALPAELLRMLPAPPFGVAG